MPRAGEPAAEQRGAAELAVEDEVEERRAGEGGSPPTGERPSSSGRFRSRASPRSAIATTAALKISYNFV